MRRLVLLGLVLVGCSSGSPHPAPAKASVGGGYFTRDTPGPTTLVSASLDGATLEAMLPGGRATRVDATGASGPPVVNPAHNAVLLQVGEGASTTLYGIWTVFGGRLVRVPTPRDQPGVGTPWQVPIGAGVVTASGLRCDGQQVDLLHADSGAVTVSSYVIDGGEAHAVSPAPAPPADQVGSLDC